MSFFPRTKVYWEGTPNHRQWITRLIFPHPYNFGSIIIKESYVDGKIMCTADIYVLSTFCGIKPVSTLREAKRLSLIKFLEIAEEKVKDINIFLNTIKCLRYEEKNIISHTQQSLF